jgi:CheY-like chemotaxis protein
MTRILVLDDNADSLSFLVEALSMHGAVVLQASDAATCYEKLKNEVLDVLLADIAMPVEDGCSLIERFRALERQHARKRLPAIALTAYSSPIQRANALAAGYDLYLTKPVFPNDLVNAVATIIRASQGRKERVNRTFQQ